MEGGANFRKSLVSSSMGVANSNDTKKLRFFLVFFLLYKLVSPTYNPFWSLSRVGFLLGSALNIALIKCKTLFTEIQRLLLQQRILFFSSTVAWSIPGKILFDIHTIYLFVQHKFAVKIFFCVLQFFVGYSLIFFFYLTMNKPLKNVFHSNDCKEILKTDKYSTNEMF